LFIIDDFSRDLFLANVLSGVQKKAAIEAAFL
jgi:hypothetical protein